jgi:hypothetical protein
MAEKRQKAAPAESCQDCFRNGKYVEFKRERERERESKKCAKLTLRHASRASEKSAVGLIPDE